MDPGGERSGREQDAWASERVYRALTRAYPEEVRLRYAGEMVGYFGDLCREEWHSRGSRGLASLWARTLPELLFTALQERSVLVRRSAYLPLDAGTVQRLGALCALLGGIMGVSFPLIGPLLVALGNLTGYDSYGSGPLVQLFWLSLLLGALSLSSLGLFGLYGAVVAHSGRPGPLAGAGAVFAAAPASLWLSIGGFVIANQLASGTPLSALFEWVWYVGAILMGPSILCWFVGLLLLGTVAALRPLPRRLRVSPLALFALIATTYEFGSHFFTVDSPLTLARGLPFAFVAILGWILLKEDHGAGPLAADCPAGSAGAARAATVPAGGRSASSARFDASGAEREKETELLRAVRRYGPLTVAGAAMECSLSVAEADRMLSELAGKGHLEVRVERGRLLYSLWGDRG